MFQTKDPLRYFAGDLYKLFDHYLLYNYPAHGDAVTIPVTDLNPVKAFSICTHINIHSVVRTTSGVELCEYPVALGIIDR